MYILHGWRKSSDTTIIGCSENKYFLLEICLELNYAAGYVPGGGVWTDECKGCFCVEFVPNSAVEMYKKGIKFINYED